jgi:murein DD-endopeptidase MepM/ murein hydrolase activator NlpD
MSDRFFTFMLIPERSDRIRKLSVPSAYLKVVVGLGLGLLVSGIFIFFDYIHLLSQVAENKKLRVENHVLKLDVQEAKSKLDTLDQSVSRLKSFAYKLRVISNLDQPGASRLLEAPQNGSGGSSGGGGPGSEEEGGSINDPNNPEGSPGAYVPPEESQPPPENAGMHAQLEYQRSQTALRADEVEIASDNLLLQVSSILERSQSLQDETQLEEQNFANLQEQVQDRVARLRSTPSILPARGWISSEFGYRMNPFSGRKTFHGGLDVANYTGTAVHAPADGMVTFAGPRGGFGLVVQIDHGYGVQTRYGHNSRVAVKAGLRVTRGQKIAEIGSTGRSTGPHLHYEVVLNNKLVNPRAFVLEEVF